MIGWKYAWNKEIDDISDNSPFGADLVAVLVGPHQDRDPPQDVHLIAVIVGGAPAQRHGQRVGEGLLSIAASGQTQGLDIPGQILYRGHSLSVYQNSGDYAVGILCIRAHC